MGERVKRTMISRFKKGYNFFNKLRVEYANEFFKLQQRTSAPRGMGIASAEDYKRMAVIKNYSGLDERGLVEMAQNRLAMGTRRPIEAWDYGMDKPVRTIRNALKKYTVKGGSPEPGIRYYDKQPDMSHVRTYRLPDDVLSKAERRKRRQRDWAIMWAKEGKRQTVKAQREADLYFKGLLKDKQFQEGMKESTGNYVNPLQGKNLKLYKGK